MTTDYELIKAIRGLQSQTAAIQAKQTEILRTLAEQSESNRSTIGKIQALQIFHPAEPKNSFEVPYTEVLRFNNTAPDLVKDGFNPMALLRSDSTMTDKPRSKPDLSNLNEMTTDLVGDNKGAFNLVKEVKKVANLIIEFRETNLMDTVVLEIQGRIDNGVYSDQIDTVEMDDQSSSHVRSSSLESVKRMKNHATFVKDRGKPMAMRRHHVLVSAWLQHYECDDKATRLRKFAKRKIVVRRNGDGSMPRRGGGSEEAGSRRAAKRRKQGTTKSAARQEANKIMACRS